LGIKFQLRTIGRKSSLGSFPNTIGNLNLKGKFKKEVFQPQRNWNGPPIIPFPLVNAPKFQELSQPKKG